MKKIIFIIFIFMLLTASVNASDTLAANSKSAILIEQSTGKVLYEKNSHEKLPPASMTKIMSMLLIMEAIENKIISYEDDVVISENAANMGGSQVFLEKGEKYKVKDLLKSIAVASGNDAVVAMAEKISGSESEFVKLMNKKAKELGLKDTYFLNPHGLDAEGHVSSAYDMAMMAKELIKHEDILKYTSVYEDYLKKKDGSSTWLVNTNRLIRFYDGVDGLKTGFTDTAKYCLTATAKKKDMRLISVVMGVETTSLRSKDTIELLNYGFANYKVDKILAKNKVLGKVNVKKSKITKVNVKLLEDINILKKVGDKNTKYKINLKLNDIEAPITKKDIIGTVEILDENNKLITEGDVVVDKDIKKANFFDYLSMNFKTIIQGI